MKKIATLIDRELKWSQPSMRKQEYALHAGEELAATLVFPNSFRSNATGESEDGSWDFTREGPFHTRIVVRRSGSPEEIAVFKKSAWKACGTLELPDGRTYRSASNFWASRYGFTDSDAQPLVDLKNCGVLHRAANLTIAPRAADIPELPMMVMLAWYLDVMMQNDTVAVTTAVASSG
ncbi:MAG TPA: hypothetical protein VJS69_01450 [Candidatus Krumholzibacteria bacterium]|nr:hypothetical protein [Candidatus Krumholzibacteria bacterium]